MARFIESFLPLFVVLAITAFIAVRRGLTFRRVREAHERLAAHYHGRVTRRGWSRPWTEFYLAGERVVVSVYREPNAGLFDRKSTHVHIAWPHSPEWLSIRPRSLLFHLGGWFGGNQINSGSEAFRRQFQVRSPDESAAQDLLTPAVQAALYRLLDFHEAGNVSVFIANRLLHVRVAGSLDESGELVEFVEFVEQVLAFHAAAVTSFKAGIEFAHPGAAALPVLEGAVCQVCGDKIERDLVFCGTCRTPHHRECWQYNGQCSIFGCRETRYVSPEAVRR